MPPPSSFPQTMSPATPTHLRRSSKWQPRPYRPPSIFPSATPYPSPVGRTVVSEALLCAPPLMLLSERPGQTSDHAFPRATPPVGTPLPSIHSVLDAPTAPWLHAPPAVLDYRRMSHHELRALMPPPAEEHGDDVGSGVGGDGGGDSGCGPEGGADNPSTSSRSVPTSCAPSPSIREPLKSDGSTIRDSVSGCSTFSGVSVPSPPKKASLGRPPCASVCRMCESKSGGRGVESTPADGAGDPLWHPPAGTFSTAVLNVSTSDGDEEDTCSVDYALSLVVISDDSSSSSSSNDSLSIKSALSSPLFTSDCSPTADGGGDRCRAFFSSCLQPVDSPEVGRADGDAPADAPLLAEGVGATASDYQAVARWLAGKFQADADRRPLLGECRAQIIEAAPIARRLRGPPRCDSSSATDAATTLAADYMPAADYLPAADLSKLCFALVPYALELKPVTDANVVLSAAEGGLHRGPLMRLSELPPVRLGPTDPWRYDMPVQSPGPSNGPRLSASTSNAQQNDTVPWNSQTARRSRSPVRSQRSRRLLRTHTMPSRSPTPSRLGPDRGPLHEVVDATRRQAQLAAERAAFPICGPPSGGVLLGGGPGAAPPTHLFDARLAQRQRLAGV
eukprot:TRINITY_DN5768_c0_g1_i2.p1 TRINITY_DN5768_c0_g1~~TRINITY_DN5768_c0_g1_i2.p1  ORF type:complete len:619 (-),score=62.73 TRINITY_DN5768_c0_g1_i2:1345-3201(-)